MKLWECYSRERINRFFVVESNYSSEEYTNTNNVRHSV